MDKYEAFVREMVNDDLLFVSCYDDEAGEIEYFCRYCDGEGSRREILRPGNHPERCLFRRATELLYGRGIQLRERPSANATPE